MKVSEATLAFDIISLSEISTHQEPGNPKVRQRQKYLDKDINLTYQYYEKD